VLTGFAALLTTLWATLMLGLLGGGSASYTFPHRFPHDVDSPVLAIELAHEKSEADAVLHGRTFQCGEGWHSNENAVRLWIPSPRVPKETDARCYAFTTAYATMIPRCNVF